MAPESKRETAGETSEEGTAQSKKRNRAVLSCLTCHQRRVKCDRSQPCKACIAYGSADTCTFAKSTERRQRKIKSEDESRRASTSSSEQEPEGFLPTFPLRGVETEAITRPLGPLRRDSSETEILPVFSAFIDRFHRHSGICTSDNDGQEGTFGSAYHTDDLCSIHDARFDLPLPERAKMMVLFFMEELDWLYGTDGYDEMEKWLSHFLERISRRSLCGDEMVKGDATRLCLIVTIITCSVQIASEGLIRIYYLDSQPASFSLSKLSRTLIKEKNESHIRRLLDIATRHDGPSADLVRCSLIYMFFLKNEGRYGDRSNQPLTASISQNVELSGLHLDPGPSFTDQQRQSRRRLFWTYYCFDRISAAQLGYPIRIKDEAITTKEPCKESWSPWLGKRNHLFTIYHIKLAQIAGQVSMMVQSNAANAQTIGLVEEEFQKVSRNLTPELHSSLPPLGPEFRQIRSFDFQRHLFNIGFASARGSLHRLCFFPSESISHEQVQESRKICIESAMTVIRVQESLRMRLVSEHHLRCFYVPYFLLDASMTLILASLIELGNSPSGQGVPQCVQEYMKRSHRARDILSSIPSDFIPALQGVRLLSRVLAKAEQIINLHAHHKLTPADSKNAIRDVLRDEDGSRQPIPFLESTAHTSSFDVRSESQGRAKDDGKYTDAGSSGQNNASSTGPSDVPTSLTTPSDLATQTSGNNQTYLPFDDSLFASAQTNFMAAEEPTYSDFGIDFLNNLAVSVPNAVATESSEEGSQVQFQQLQDPVLQQQQSATLGLDDQMNIWLASLQNCA